MIENTYKTKVPPSIPLILAMSLLIFIQVYSVIIINYDPDRTVDVVLYWFRIVSTIPAVIVLAVSIARLFKKPSTMQINHDCLYIHKRKLSPEDIKEIRIQGYFKPLIGIIPKGKKVTPIDLCFCVYPDQEDKAIKELTEWAKEHQVEVVIYKQIKRWI